MEVGTLHAFEKAGLGRAPFALVGVERKVGPIRIGPDTYAGSPGQPMGTCAFCSTGIAECCIIRDRDGKQFIVGNVCVNKTGDSGLIKNLKDAMRPIRLEARHAQEATKIKELATLLDDPSIAARLMGRAHPQKWGQIKGLTLWDWAAWMWNHAGNSGKLKTLRTVKKALV